MQGSVDVIIILVDLVYKALVFDGSGLGLIPFDSIPRWTVIVVLLCSLTGLCLAATLRFANPTAKSEWLNVIDFNKPYSLTALSRTHLQIWLSQ